MTNLITDLFLLVNNQASTINKTAAHQPFLDIFPSHCLSSITVFLPAIILQHLFITLSHQQSFFYLSHHIFSSAIVLQHLSISSSINHHRLSITHQPSFITHQPSFITIVFQHLSICCPSAITCQQVPLSYDDFRSVFAGTSFINRFLLSYF